MELFKQVIPTLPADDPHEYFFFAINTGTALVTSFISVFIRGASYDILPSTLSLFLIVWCISEPLLRVDPRATILSNLGFTVAVVLGVFCI